MNFTIPGLERPISDALASMPRQFRDLARKGFTVLAGIGPQHYAQILRGAVTTLENRRASFDDLEKNLSLSKNDLSSLFAASMVVVPLLGEGGGIDEFLSAATRIELIASDAVPKIRPFLETVVAERVQVSRALKRAALPAEVLPSVTNVEITVDLRMAFDGEAVTEAAPVAVVHIDTDANDQEIWFQASKGQMEHLKKDIDRAIKRMEAAEKWGERART